MWLIKSVKRLKWVLYSQCVRPGIPVTISGVLVLSRGSVCNVLLTSCEDGVCRLWSETLLPEDSLLGGQISENTHSFSSSLPGLAGNKDKIQHALEVHFDTYEK